MKPDFEKILKDFEAAGNSISGRPRAIYGRFDIKDYKTGSHIHFGSNVVLQDTVLHFPRGGGTIYLADGVYYRGFTHVSPKSTLRVGENTAFNARCEVSAWENASIYIGAGCLFAAAKLRTCDMHPIFDIASGKRINPSRDLVIEDHVWVGEDVTVAKGARIGAGSMIGSGSIVKGYIPNDSLAVGVPAKVIRSGIAWQRPLEFDDNTAAGKATEPRRQGARMFYVTVRKDAKTNLYSMNLMKVDGANQPGRFDLEGPEEAGVYSGFFEDADAAKGACRRDVDQSADFEAPNFID
jgi:acetyltransferase-like isoleucine patch superfamily enzyme